MVGIRKASIWTRTAFTSHCPTLAPSGPVPSGSSEVHDKGKDSGIRQSLVQIQLLIVTSGATWGSL